ncbi:hypothetical protein B0H15DRAFT_847710 [Mycena belliarum]|uniref:DUF6534 domain-containing protein n=1 Tax=Mycena belliarum TaxID=1033014 RepID=A0AAD6XMH2_9AGAR|nr:hypothetical protein B0H15DRAFT_847710 [Mycena belliae]
MGFKSQASSPHSTPLPLVALLNLKPLQRQLTARFLMTVAQLVLPLFLGTLINWSLFGTFLVQTYIYFLAFPKDRRLCKLLVGFVLFLELVETISNGHDVINIFGAGWGNMEALDDVGWAWFSVPVMGSIVACVGQLFYARRIYIIGHNLYICGLIIIVSVIQLGGGIWTGVEICIARKYSLLQYNNVVATATWLAATALCDLIIVFSTVFFLVKLRQPRFRATYSNVSRIIRMTLTTGLLCASFALFDLFLFVMYKGTNYHLALCIELSKMYSNSILLILNSRGQFIHPSSEIHNHNQSDIVFNHNPSISMRTFRVDFSADAPGPTSQGGLEENKRAITTV